jgi:hypothetical protein
MGLMIFSLICVLLALAAYVVLRTCLRSRKPFVDLLLLIKPLSPRASDLIWRSTQGPIPATWIDVTDLIRIRQNSTIFTMLSDRFRRMIRHCHNEDDAAEMEDTYLAALRAHSCLTKSLLLTVVGICFGKIAHGRCCISMASVARSFGAEYLMVREMAEVIDDSLIDVLEGHLLHGS